MVAPGQESTRREGDEGMPGAAWPGIAPICRRGGQLPRCHLDRRERLSEGNHRQDITAKDFRTWAGTVLAAMALGEVQSFDSAAQAKRNLRAAIERVSARLGNTPTICRKCYVHPEVLNAYLDGNLVVALKAKAEHELRHDVQDLKPEEAAVLALLRTRPAVKAEKSGWSSASRSSRKQRAAAARPA